MPFRFTAKTQVGANPIYSADYDGTPCTPSDSADLANGACVGFYVTTAGNVNVDVLNNLDPSASGGTAVFTGLVAGQIVLCATKRIRATSTTATGIFALNRQVH